jgi:hypothetical protein
MSTEKAEYITNTLDNYDWHNFSEKLVDIVKGLESIDRSMNYEIIWSRLVNAMQATDSLQKVFREKEDRRVDYLFDMAAQEAYNQLYEQGYIATSSFDFFYIDYTVIDGKVQRKESPDPHDYSLISFKD